MSPTPQLRFLEQAEAVPQAAEFCWLVEHFDIANKSTGHYYTGKVGIGDRVLTTMDPRQAQRYDTWRDANNASAKLGSTLTGTWRAMQHGFHRMEPQQAEAVPPTHVMVPVEPTDEMIDAACEAAKDLYWVDFVRAYKAAIAQQKGGV